MIVFGKGPRVEAPPAPTEVNLLGIESTIDPEYTDLGAAIKLALATFPEDTARRLVVLSDGNENRGNAVEQALAAKALGVQIDVLPIEYFYDREVLVEKVSLPPDVKKGETVNINVVIRASEPTRGTLQIFQKARELPVPGRRQREADPRRARARDQRPHAQAADHRAELLHLHRRVRPRPVERRPPRHQQRRRGVHPRAGDRPGPADRGDARRARRAGPAPCGRRGSRSRPWSPPGSSGGGSVGGDALPTDLAQLQPFDTVILGNVPKDSFTEAQQKLLEANVHDMGAGLVMLGGPDSFGAGGWMNSPVEKALPVDMQIKALKVQGKSAMVLIMHASEIPEGNFWQKEVAKEAIKTLSSYDYAGMLHWEGPGGLALHRSGRSARGGTSCSAPSTG